MVLKRGPQVIIRTTGNLLKMQVQLVDSSETY